MRDNKQYTVKIFDQDGTTRLKNLAPNVLKKQPEFQSKINSIFGKMSLDLDLPFDDFGEGNTVDFMNIVEVHSLKVVNGVQYDYIIYKGFISAYTPYIKSNGSEGISIELLSLGALLGRSYYKNGTNFTVSHSGEDPQDIAEAIIDHFNTIYGGNLITYDSGTSTESVGQTISLQFSDQKWNLAMDTTYKTAGTDWWWTIDATGELQFKSKPTSATHTFTIGKDVATFEVYKSCEKVINDAQVRGTPTTDFSDSTSQANFGTGSPATGKITKIDSQGSLQNADAVNQYGDKLIADNKDSRVSMKVTINDLNKDESKGYNIETIKVGDTCKIRNFNAASDLFDDNMHIVSVKYKGDAVILELDEFSDDFARELDEFVNG